MTRLDPIFRTLAPGRAAAPRTPGAGGGPQRAEEGYLHCGPNGAGQLVKMVHNGIEYGLMAAYAEGFNVLTPRGRGPRPTGWPTRTTAPGESRLYRTSWTSPEIGEVWRRGSVVGSWLLGGSDALAQIDRPDGNHDTDVVQRFTFVQDAADPRLADYVRLTDVELRKSLEAAHGLFMAEGERVIHRAVAAGYAVRSLLATERKAAALASLAELRAPGLRRPRRGG